MRDVPEEGMPSLQRRLADAREDLRLMEEREAQYPLSTDIPLLLVKEKRRLLAKIDELEQQLATQSTAPADSSQRQASQPLNQSLYEPSGKPRIFLCHASEDKPRVRELYRQLKQAGYHPWLDKEDLLPGQDWRHEIEKMIRDPYNIIVVCLSNNSVTKRGVVQQEIKRALDVLDYTPEGSIYLIPARLEECQVPDRLSELHWVELFEPDGFGKLKQALDFELGKRQPSRHAEASAEAKVAQPTVVEGRPPQPVAEAQVARPTTLERGQSFEPLKKRVWAYVLNHPVISIAIAAFVVVLLANSLSYPGAVVRLNPSPTPTATHIATYTPTAQKVEKKAEVSWYVRPNEVEQKWENEVAIPNFEAKNPNIKIDLVVVPWADFDTKMQTMIAAGLPPAIWSYGGPSSFQDYVKRGLVADLTPLIERDKFDLSDFEPAALDIYKVDNKVMGLPVWTTGSFIFYNKDLFDAAGVKYPPTNWDDTSWTYDAFLEKCKALTKNIDDPAKAVFGCNMGFWPNDQYAWMFGQDFYPDDAYKTGFADKTFLNSAPVIKAFQARQDIVWKLHYMPDPAQMDAMGSGDVFENAKVAMNLTGGWGWSQYSGHKLHEKFKWGVAAIPYGAPGRKDAVFTDLWMMSSKTAYPDEAWTFLKYLVSAMVQQNQLERTGGVPVRKSLEERWYKSFPSMAPEEVKEVHLGALKYGRESPNHLLVHFDQLNKIVASAVDPIISNEKEAADVLPEADKKLEEALKMITVEYKR